jgi:hypothetical protein
MITLSAVGHQRKFPTRTLYVISGFAKCTPNQRKRTNKKRSSVEVFTTLRVEFPIEQQIVREQVSIMENKTTNIKKDKSFKKVKNTSLQIP